MKLRSCSIKVSWALALVFGMLFFPEWGECIQITPSYQVFDLKPGQKSEGSITLVNNGDENLIVGPGVKDWVPNEHNPLVQTSDWLKIDEETFLLPKGESKTIAFTIKAPKKAKGEVWGMATFLLQTEVQTNINQRLSSAIYVRLTGTDKRKAKLSQLGIKMSSKTLQMGLVIENRGNVHVRPRGEITVSDESGRKWAYIKISQGAPTYPATSRTYIGEVKDLVVPPGNYTAEIKLVDGDSMEEIVNQKEKLKFDEEGNVTLR